MVIDNRVTPYQFPIPQTRTGEVPARAPQREQEQFRPANPDGEITGRRSTRVAPVNVIPSDERLNILVQQAKDAMRQGRTPDRGSIVNLIV